jgi:isopenicillin-N N-acyltransferase-like protein
VEHCTAIAAGPPDTSDGNTYVGQTWDWMESVYGLSSMLHWKRPEGPSLLAYAYPGLWTGAGLNSKGLALTWTSGSGRGIAGPRAGIPSYILIAQILYQDSLQAAIEEARRARHAGWFTFVLADGEGRLANIEGTPEELAVETGRGHLARVDFGSRGITKTPGGEEVKVHARCRRMAALLEERRGKLDPATLRGFFGDHGAADEPATRVCNHANTLDAMLFNTSRREAQVARGPACEGSWQTFRFEG